MMNNIEVFYGPRIQGRTSFEGKVNYERGMSSLIPVRAREGHCLGQNANQETPIPPRASKIVIGTHQQ